MERQGGGYLYKRFCPDAALVNFFALEPFFYEMPWTAALKDKKVLIVHAFADSIVRQYERRELLFRNANVLPAFKSLQVVKAVQSNANNDVPFESWSRALAYMQEQISALDFDVAIVGAGAYGLPIAAYIKSLGKQAVHMAGVTQMLFGIRGKRWDNDPRYQSLFNEYWIRPSADETPAGKEVVEGGTYW